MNATHIVSRNTFSPRPLRRERLPRHRAASTVARMKSELLQKYSRPMGERRHLLQLALNEAEAIAWQTEMPHLFFPLLAEEKAEAALAWHRRQRCLRHAAEVAFAE